MRWFKAIVAGGTDLDFDLNQDGSVNLADVTVWLAQAGAANLGSGNSYLAGDGTLDGAVDAADFIVWNNNKIHGLGRLVQRRLQCGRRYRRGGLS